MKKMNVFYALLIIFAMVISGNIYGQTTILDEEFNPDLSGVTTYSQLGDQVWGTATYGGDGACSKMTGYVHPTAFDNIDWLISPAIDLTGYTSTTLDFSEAINYGEGTVDIYQKVLVSTDYNGDGTPETEATWDTLTVTGRSPGNAWDFYPVDQIDLSAYDGEASVYIAFYYLSSSTTGVAATWEIDYFTVSGIAPTTSVSFAAASATVNEGDGTYDLLISITNPSLFSATQCQVALTVGDAADINNYITQDVTFDAGSSADETISIRITDDSDVEGPETLTLNIQNVSGGNSAAAGANSSFDLTITDNDPIAFPVNEAFDGDSIPVGWSFTDFVISTTNNAGGTANEVKLDYNNDNAGSSNITSPPINTTGQTQALLSWNQKVDYYSTGDFTITVQASTDGTTFTDVWSQTVTADETTSKEVVLDAGDGIGSGSFYLRWIYSAMNGNPFSFWYIDDIVLDTYSIIAEPANHVSTFAAAANGFDQIDLTWADNDGDPAAEGFLIKVSDVSYGDITDPTDTNPEADDTDLSDGAGAMNVSHGVQAYSWTGLSPETTYYFKIYPYTNTDVDIDYKTDGTIPTADATTDAAPALVINEFQADPDAGSGDANGDGTVNTTQDEFVELYNNSDNAIDLSGYELHDGATTSLRHTFPAGTILAPESFIVVFAGGTPTGSFGNSIVQVASSGGLGLNNGGDVVIIKDSTGVEVISYTYGSEGGDNQSLTRDPDITGNFVKHSTLAGGYLFTPGLMNDSTSSYLTATTGDWTTVLGTTDASTNVFIPAGVAIDIPNSKEIVTCKNLIIEAGGVVTIEGTLNIDNSLFIKSDSTGFGTLLNTGTVSVTNETIVQQYLGETTQEYNWHYVTLPFDVTADVFPGVDPGTGTVYAAGWDEASNPDGWVYLTDGGATYLGGTGLAVPISSATTVNYFGAGNALSFSDNILSNLSLTAGDKAGFHLIGNPYTAPIDIDNLTESTGWTADVWVRVDGTFKTWGVGGTGTLTDGIVPALQSFWVRVDNPVNQIAMNTDDLTTGTDPLYKSSDISQALFSIERDGYKDEMIVYINDNAENGLDIMDTEKMFATDNNYPQISMVVDGALQTVNGINNVEETMTIPVAFKTSEAGTFTFSAEEITFDADVELFIKDAQTGDVIDLNKADTYEFYSDVTDNTGRFSLIITKSATDIAAISNGINIYTSNNSIVVKTNETVNGVMSVFDISGKTILSQNVNINGTQSFEIEQPSGVYFVNISSGSVNITEKVVIR